MNVFVLDKDPVKAAVQQCDKHIVKMILESAQMLSTSHRCWMVSRSENLPSQVRLQSITTFYQTIRMKIYSTKQYISITLVRYGLGKVWKTTNGIIAILLRYVTNTGTGMVRYIKVIESFEKSLKHLLRTYHRKD